MFDLAELYAAWTEDPSSFWYQAETNQFALQERVTVDPDAILDEDVWSEVLSSACPPPQESIEEAHTWLGIIISGLRTWSQRAVQPAAGNATNEDEMPAIREALEKYLFLTRLHLARLDASLDAIQPTSKRVKTTGVVGEQIKGLLDAVSKSLQGGISKAFPPTESAKRASLALLYLEPSCRMLQHEVVVADPQLAKEIVRLLSLGVKLQHQQAMVRTQLIQLLTYYEHAVPVTVQFLDTLQTQYDHTALAELVLKDLSAEASSWSDAQNSATITRAKCVNTFLQNLMQVMPALVAANLPAICVLIGSPVAQLRQAILDIAAAIIHIILAPSENGNSVEGSEEQDGLAVPTSSLSHLALNSSSGRGGGSTTGGGFADMNAGPQRYKPAFDLIQLIQARTNDVSHFCRLRAVQVFTSVAQEPAFISLRDRFTEVAISKMKDRTQLVRRQAMRLMKQLIDSHPQVMHPNCLSKSVWESSLQQIDAQLDQTEPGDMRQQLEAAHAFVQFTLKFIKCVDEAVSVAQTLLLSRAKSDILDAIDLLVYADAYGVESSAKGIRAIVHLVWAKADNDEGNVVCKTAVSTYHDLFMTAPPELDARRGAQLVAENLIALTLGASQGELISLERLLMHAVEEDMISVPVVGRLWGIYKTELELEPEKRRGAAMILSMLSLADRSIACSGISSVVEIGLSHYGVADPELAAYSFTIMKRSIDADTSAQRLPHTYELFDQINAFLLKPSESKHAMLWNTLAKEALAAINVLCDCAPKVYTRLLRDYVAKIFGEQKDDSLASSQRMQLFAQLLFLAGEVALNLLVYLERSELEFKRRLQDDEKNADSATTAKTVNANSSNTNAGRKLNETNSGGDDEEEEEELMAGGGSREDDFQDVLRDIREEGILYSDRALLKPFTEIVIDICKNELAGMPDGGCADILGTPENIGDDSATLTPGETADLDTSPTSDETKQKSDPSEESPQMKALVMSATQTLSKFMCVSSRFCAENLPLLVDIMGKHKNNVVRSNFVVALGDIAICFNRLIDQHTEYLYDRLNDPDPQVQRTCIVALTFLILAGQIKVKGKLGEMAKAVAHPNRKISSLATMFFRELATKENAVYNSFLDMMSTLIADEALPDADMLRILKFLAEFIDRDRHIKQLTDKLVARLPRCGSQRQWNAYVQVLKSMPKPLDENVKKVISVGYRSQPGQGNSTVSDQAMNEEEADEEEEEEEEEEEGDAPTLPADPPTDPPTNPPSEAAAEAAAAAVDDIEMTQ